MLVAKASRWRRVGKLLGSGRFDRSAGDARSRATEIPIELLAQARDRVRRLAKTLSIGSSILVAGDLLATFLGWVSAERVWVLPAGLLMLLPISLLVSYVTAQPRFSDRQVYFLGLSYVVGLAFLAGFLHCVHESQRFGQVTGFGPHAILLCIFPLLLPCPPRPTLLVACVADLAIWGGFLVALGSGLAAPNAASFVDLGIVSVGSIGLAYTVSRTVYGLQADIAEARRLGSYVLESKIGGGGMGEVWRGRHGMLASPAAIKLMHPGLRGKADTSALDRFRREARVTAALRSPHTVRLYDFGRSDDGTFYYAMELLDGIDLAALVRRFGAQPPERVRGILLQACDSLAEAHGLGLVHRDIKPENLMLCRQGRAVEILKVLDFGVVGLLAEAELPPALGAEAAAAEKGEDAGLTRPGTFLGTLAYTAPETFLGRGSDSRSDIYALGCVGYWLLTGRKVVEATLPAQQIAAALKRVPPSPRSLGFLVPAELEGILMSCLDKDPAARPQDADQLASLLAAGGEGWTATEARAWWHQHLAAPAAAPVALEKDKASWSQAQATWVSPRPRSSGAGEESGTT